MRNDQETLKNNLQLRLLSFNSQFNGKLRVPSQKSHLAYTEREPESSKIGSFAFLFKRETELEGLCSLSRPTSGSSCRVSSAET